jgi:hypothetical protein
VTRVLLGHKLVFLEGSWGSVNSPSSRVQLQAAEVSRTKSCGAPMRRSKFDEFYAVRLDGAGRARGARFPKLNDAIVSAAVDAGCRTLLLPSKTVSAIAMQLPPGRMRGRRLVMPRIRRGLYDDIVVAVAAAEEKFQAQVKIRAAKELAFTKKLIAETEAVLAEIRRTRESSDI